MNGYVKIALVVVVLIAAGLAGLTVGASEAHVPSSVSARAELLVSNKNGLWTVEVLSATPPRDIYAYLSGPAGFKTATMSYVNSSPVAYQPFGIPLNSSARETYSSGIYMVTLTASGIKGAEPSLTYSYTIVVVLKNGMSVQLIGTLKAEA